MPTRKRYRCRFCGRDLPAWLPVPKRPEASMRLHHLSQRHPEELRPDLVRLATECISTVVVKAYGGRGGVSTHAHLRLSNHMQARRKL
jgi:hypothetical protein